MKKINVRNLEMVWNWKMITALLKIVKVRILI